MSSSPTHTRSVRISLFSYGHANGPIVQPQSPRELEAPYHKTLAYNIRHLPNPPRHLRAKSTGLSRRLQKEFLQNGDVEGVLVQVRGDISDAIREGVVALSDLSPRGNQEEEAEAKFSSGIQTGDNEDEDGQESPADIDLVVTICCEEGRHRSVAFVEELARRLAGAEEDEGINGSAMVDLHVVHRDIGDAEDGGLPAVGQRQGPNKAQTKSRQRERREKGNRSMQFEDDF